MTMSGKKFKKELVQGDGSIKTFEYEPAKGTQTVNQQLTANQEEVLEEWEEEAEYYYTSDFENNLKDKKGCYAKYAVAGKNESLLLRNGGVVTQVEKDYLMLKNTVNNLAWSVQYAKLRKIYVWKKNNGKDDGEADAPELRQVQKKVKKERRDAEIEERKEEEEAKEEEQPDAPPPPPPAPRKLSDEEASELLKTSYYEKDMKFGRDKLYSTLVEQGHRITRKQVDNWLKKQKLYQLDKVAFAPKDFVLQRATAPNKVWNIDLLEIDGDKILLNCVDRFSKVAYSRILRNKTANQVVNALKSIFRTAKPSTITCDNGVEFVAQTTQTYLKNVDVLQVFSSPYLPQSNGVVERFNRTLKDQFRKMTYQAGEEKVVFNQRVLNRLLKAYNNSVHSIIKMSPNEAMKPDNLEKVRKAIEKRMSVDAVKNKDDLKAGDEVRISLNKGNDAKTKEFRTNWSEELYKVATVVRFKGGMKPVVYKIKDEDGNKVRGMFKRAELQYVEEVENDDEVDVPYEIEKFVKEEGDEILVSYKGYRASGNRYIEKSILKNDLGEDTYKKLYDEMVGN